MKIVVKKFGGTSVGDVDRIKRVAKRVSTAWSEGNSVVVVVSARAGVTNSLLDRAYAIQKNPTDGELDVLMTCRTSHCSDLHGFGCNWSPRSFQGGGRNSYRGFAFKIKN